jgi:type II secretory pathway component GspD/PulD (secretin)
MHLQFGFNRILLLYFLLALLLHLILPAVLSGSEPNQISNEEFEKKLKYELSIKDNLITLNAEDAFLKKILEDIGQRMNIEVFARIPAEDKITIQFANLTLEEALKKFKTNYALVTDSKDKNGNIKRIVVVPEGQQAQLSLREFEKNEPKVDTGVAGENTSKPEPFKFEFDPSKYMENKP